MVFLSLSGAADGPVSGEMASKAGGVVRWAEERAMNGKPREQGPQCRLRAACMYSVLGFVRLNSEKALILEK